MQSAGELVSLRRAIYLPEHARDTSCGWRQPASKPPRGLTGSKTMTECWHACQRARAAALSRNGTEGPSGTWIDEAALKNRQTRNQPGASAVLCGHKQL